MNHHPLLLEAELSRELYLLLRPVCQIRDILSADVIGMVALNLGVGREPETGRAPSASKAAQTVQL